MIDHVDNPENVHVMPDVPWDRFVEIKNLDQGQITIEGKNVHLQSVCLANGIRYAQLVYGETGEKVLHPPQLQEMDENFDYFYSLLGIDLGEGWLLRNFNIDPGAEGQPPQVFSNARKIIDFNGTHNEALYSIEHLNRSLTSGNFSQYTPESTGIVTVGNRYDTAKEMFEEELTFNITVWPTPANESITFLFDKEGKLTHLQFTSKIFLDEHNQPIQFGEFEMGKDMLPLTKNDQIGIAELTGPILETDPRIRAIIEKTLGVKMQDHLAIDKAASLAQLIANMNSSQPVSPEKALVFKNVLMLSTDSPQTDVSLA